jgi:hypothetical protein
MKKILLITLILSFNFNYSQIEELKGIWISEENEAISIIDTLDSFDGLMSKNNYNYFLLKIKSDTLVFKPWDSSPNDDNSNNLEFKLIDYNKKSVTIQPISNLSIDFFKKDSPIEFIAQKYVIDKAFEFEKLIFHSSSCFGSCPIIDLEISSNRKIKLIGNFYIENTKKIDDTRSGSYNGEISKKDYKKLIDIIIKSRITTYKDTDINTTFCCDGSVKTFILYHNGKRKYYRAMISPPLLDELIAFLYTIDKKSNLQRTSEAFEIEK